LAQVPSLRKFPPQLGAAFETRNPFGYSGPHGFVRRKTGGGLDCFFLSPMRRPTPSRDTAGPAFSTFISPATLPPSYPPPSLAEGVPPPFSSDEASNADFPPIPQRRPFETCLFLPRALDVRPRPVCRRHSSDAHAFVFPDSLLFPPASPISSTQLPTGKSTPGCPFPAHSLPSHPNPAAPFPFS